MLVPQGTRTAKRNDEPLFGIDAEQAPYTREKSRLAQSKHNSSEHTIAIQIACPKQHYRSVSLSPRLHPSAGSHDVPVPFPDELDDTPESLMSPSSRCPAVPGSETAAAAEPL